MRRAASVVVALAVAAVALAVPRGAAAHPLGNFTVNHYAAIELAGDRVFVRYVLDLAEIPTFQSGDRVRAPGYAAEAANGLDLRLGGERVVLHPLAHRVSERPGAGGLPTLRFEAVYAAPLRATSLTFADRTFSSRIGWREITVRARDGARLVSSSVPAASRSDELRSYPRDLLRSPLDVRSATVRFAPGSASGCASGARRPGGVAHTGGRVRGAHRPARPELRRRPALPPRRGVLGCRARAHPGAWEGARRGLPRRHARPAEARLRARSHGDGHPHGRRVRAGSRDARALDGRRPGAPLPLADARLGAPRRRRRERASSSGACARPGPARTATSSITHITTTIRIPITTIRPSAASRLAGSSGSAPPRACSPARRRSSSC